MNAGPSHGSHGVRLSRHRHYRDVRTLAPRDLAPNTFAHPHTYAPSHRFRSRRMPQYATCKHPPSKQYRTPVNSFLYCPSSHRSRTIGGCCGLYYRCISTSKKTTPNAPQNTAMNVDRQGATPYDLHRWQARRRAIPKSGFRQVLVPVWVMTRAVELCRHEADRTRVSNRHQGRCRLHRRSSRTSFFL